MRRVVVTGMGLLSPFGVGVEHGWKHLLSGRSAARRITEFEVEDLPCKIAHVIPRGDGSDGAVVRGEQARDAPQRDLAGLRLLRCGDGGPPGRPHGVALQGALPSVEHWVRLLRLPHHEG